MLEGLSTPSNEYGVKNNEQTTVFQLRKYGMQQRFDFPIIPNTPIGKAFIDLGISTFSEACKYVRSLPYGRNTNRTDRLLVLEEQRGTCSGKHALLAELASEHGQSVDLMIGIFRMTKYTHPQVAPILEQYNLEYLPELHTYLRV